MHLSSIRLLFDQQGGVCGQTTHVPVATNPLRFAVVSMIESNDLEVLREFHAHAIPHAEVTTECVAEYDQRTAPFTDEI